MVRHSPPRKIRQALWHKVLRRRRQRSHAAPAQVLQRQQLAQERSRQPHAPRRRRRVVKSVDRTTKIYAPTPFYVHISRLSIGLLGIGVIAGTLMSSINPPLPTPNLSAAKKTTKIAPAAKENMLLQQKLTELTSRYPGFQTHVLLIAANGSKTELDANVVLSAASTIKIPILIALFQQIDRGQIKLDEQLTLQKSMIAAGSGELAQSPVGSKFSVQEVATKMITISDNTATNLLIDRLGGNEKLNLQFRGWGLVNTTLRNALPDFDGKNVTSPSELGKLLLGLKGDGVLSAASRSAVLEILRQTQRNTMLPAGITNKQVKIAHKTGELATIVADAGLVEMSNGQTYLLVAMVQRPANDQRAEALIRQVSQTVFTEFNKSGQPTIAPASSSQR
jgi:beta-lactamase class A